MRKKTLLVALLCVGAGLAGAPARADSSDADLRAGKERFDANDFEGAIKAWEAALAASPAGRGWIVRYNLGLAYEKAGDPTHAVMSFERFLQQAALQNTALSPRTEQARQDAARRLAQIRSTYAAVRVAEGGHPATTTIELRRAPGHEESATPPRRLSVGELVYVVPGTYLIEAHHGDTSRRTTVEARAGAEVTYVPGVQGSEPSIGERPSAPPVTTAELSKHPVDADSGTQRSSRLFTPVVVVGASVTVASFALPLVLGLRAAAIGDDADALGAGHSEYAARRDDFTSARTVYWVSFALPAILALATASTAWLLKDR